jgi:hypothetical protein
LSGVIAKPASINLRKWFLSPTGSIKPWFHTDGNLPLCSSYLPLGVPNWLASTGNQAFFWRHCRGLKKNKLPRQLGAVNIFWRRCRGERGFLQGGSLASNLLLCYCFAYFIFVCIFLSEIQKKLVSL